ncbi:UNVERIFIED_ORG: hypothetical protein J2X79_002539 [Arthrobacter globiformis]|nr:hypothetical protein [Arthrobacter globiformis]
MDANAKILPAQLPDLSATIGLATEPIYSHSRGARIANIERQQAFARGLRKRAAGAALPISPTTFSANNQAARISFPLDWAHDTPIPLVIQFKGIDAGGDAFQEPHMAAAANSVGYAFATANMHGNSYGSPSAMADALATYRHALTLAPISGVVLWGNSMGGTGALNALTTGTFPDPLGVYLTDPVVSLRHRYDNGRSAQISSAYGLAFDGPDYAAKTAGYDPNLRAGTEFYGVPVSIVASSLDTTVPLAEHGQKLYDKLSGLSPVTLLDTADAGHNVASRFQIAHFKAFLIACVGSTAALPVQTTIAADNFDRANGTALGSTSTGSLAWKSRGLFTLNSGALSSVAGITDMATIDTGTPDFIVEATIKAITGGSTNNGGGIIIRGNSDDTGFWWFSTRKSSGEAGFDFYRMEANSPVRATTTAAGLVPLAGQRVKVIASGTTITAHVDNVQVAQVTGATFNATQGRVGFYANASATTYWDDLLVTRL